MKYSNIPTAIVKIFIILGFMQIQTSYAEPIFSTQNTSSQQANLSEKNDTVEKVAENEIEKELSQELPFVKENTQSTQKEPTDNQQGVTQNPKSEEVLDLTAVPPGEYYVFATNCSSCVSAASGVHNKVTITDKCPKVMGTIFKDYDGKVNGISNTNEKTNGIYPTGNHRCRHHTGDYFKLCHSGVSKPHPNNPKKSHPSENARNRRATHRTLFANRRISTSID